MARLFRDRMAGSASDKKSRIVLALDPPADTAFLLEFAEKMISSVQDHVCAVKINFHLLLPLSGSELAGINRHAHSCGLQSIADLKLNDIESTNDVAIDHLVNKMGFDAIIANPFMGISSLASLVHQAHRIDAGVIALVYMSHPGAKEGFGLEVLRGRAKRGLYKIFLDRAARASADGVVVGATQLKILREVARYKREIPVYSPGVGAQGGDAERAIRSGASYLIIGRSIAQSSDPARTAREIQAKISSLPISN